VLVLAALAAVVAALVLGLEALGAPLWAAALGTAVVLCAVGAVLVLVARREV
jgi:hypothetical protein